MCVCLHTCGTIHMITTQTFEMINYFKYRIHAFPHYTGALPTRDLLALAADDENVTWHMPLTT